MKQTTGLDYCIQLLFNDVTVFVPADWSTRPCSRNRVQLDDKTDNNMTHQISVCTLKKLCHTFPLYFCMLQVIKNWKA